MSIGISDLAYSIRKNSPAVAVTVQLGHSQQLVAASLGYRTLASYQAAQVAGLEPQYLANISHVILDYSMLEQRANELDVALAPKQLHELICTAFRDRAPNIRIHISYAAFEDYLREQVDQIVIGNDSVSNEIARANYDGIHEIYFEIEFEQVPIGSSLAIKLSGHVGLGIDIERPYAGHVVNVEGLLRVNRLGCQCFGPLDCQITKAKLDTNWSDDAYEDGPPVRSVSQAYADLLGLDLHEVGNLVDVEAEPRDGHSGEMIYSYILDFTDYASPQLTEKILRRHSSLRIEVSSNFFEDVRGDDWPR
jgi:hypothetical protein